MSLETPSVQFVGGRLWQAYCLRYEIAGKPVVPPANRAHYIFTAVRGALMQLDRRTPAWKIILAPLALFAMLIALEASRLIGRDTTIGVLAATLMLAAFITAFSAALILTHRFDRAARVYIRKHPRVQVALAALVGGGALVAVALNGRAMIHQAWDDPISRTALILCAGITAIAIAFLALSFLTALCIHLWRCWRTVRATRPPLQ